MKSIRAILRALVPLFRRNNKKRWFKVAQGVPSWDNRNVFLASLVPAGVSVLDLGAGPQTLRKHLAHAGLYTPCDLIKRSEDTVVCDFNSGNYPRVPCHDYAIISGVLEYIRAPRQFLLYVSRTAKRALLTYNVRLPGDGLVERLSNDWINHFTREELLSLLAASCLTVERVHEHGERELILVLVPAMTVAD